MLVGVLLLLLAVTGVGHTLLVITRSEFFVSRARWDVLTRRLAAETGRHLTSRAMTGINSLPRGEWVSMGSAAVPPRARFEARAVRLSREILLIHSEGWLDTEPGRDRQVGLYWAMDPVARFSAARGIVESGGPAEVEAGGMVDPSLIHETPAPWPEATCDRFSSDVDTLFIYGISPQGELHEDARAELGREVVSGAVEPRLPSLGLLGHDALLEGADVQVSGTISPAPIDRLGRCAVPSPTNWGAPLNASDPCVAYKPVVKSEGSLIVDGGQGQGILLIAGGCDLSVCRALLRARGGCRRPRDYRGVGNLRTGPRPRSGLPQGPLTYCRLGVRGAVGVGCRQAVSGARSHPRIGLVGLTLTSAPQGFGLILLGPKNP